MVNNLWKTIISIKLSIFLKLSVVLNIWPQIKCKKLPTKRIILCKPTINGYAKLKTVLRK